MNAHDDHDGGHAAAHDHGTRRSYLIGFLLAAILTAVPFWLVMSGVLGATATAVIVTLLAIAQILIHTIFFLHVSTRSEGGWTLVALVFTGIIVVIVICGSMWIMFHLHGNMMPSPPPPVEAAAS